MKSALYKTNYEDGITKKEAKAIADAYLIQHGTYKGRTSYSRISESDERWLGEVIVVKSLASPIKADLPPVIVDKKTGSVSWEYGPAVAKVSLDN